MLTVFLKYGIQNNLTKDFLKNVSILDGKNSTSVNKIVEVSYLHSFPVIRYLRWVASRWAAALGTIVFFLSGGLGFANILNDAHPAGAGFAGWVQGLLTAIAHPVREYTLDRAAGFQWLNPVLAYLVPQRTTLFGFSLGLLALSLLWYGWLARPAL